MDGRNQSTQVSLDESRICWYSFQERDWKAAECAQVENNAEEHLTQDG